MATKKPTAKKTAKKAAVPAIKTRVIFILDESGSMGPRTDQVLEGLNEYITTLKSQNKGRLANYELSVHKFHYPSYYHTLFVNQPLNLIGTLDRGHYDATSGGNTALLDAVGRTLQSVIETPEYKTLVVIDTDGYENASQHFTYPQVSQMLQERQATGRWTFVFLGANIDAWGQGSQLGMAYVANTITYDWHNKTRMSESLATSTTNFASASATATPDIFSYDASYDPKTASDPAPTTDSKEKKDKKTKS